MKQRWNRVIYKVWSPVYDKLFNSGKFLTSRMKVFEQESFTIDQKILFVGVGTGADLELIVGKEQLDITAIDYSEAMLNKAREKFKQTTIQFLQMDAQHMSFPNHQFDVIVSSLVLSVVPNPLQCCFREMLRTLKPNGTLIIFDKISPKEQQLSLMKRMIMPLTKLLDTDIGINFEKLYEPFREELSIMEDSAIMLQGMYRKIKIKNK